MAVIADALADLRFSLRFAARRYRRYAAMEDTAQNAGLFRSLSDERDIDAEDLDRAADVDGIGQGLPTISDDVAAPLLGMGDGEPSSAASAAYRVQRAENTLERMAAQLASLSQGSQLSRALDGVRKRIEQRREGVRAARRRAQDITKGAVSARMVGIKRAEGQEVVVWFGTNRRQVAHDQFLGERADTVTHGRCRVFVPEDRTIGSLGRGFFGRILKGDNRVKLQGMDIVRERQFWSQLATEMTALDADDRQGLVFLHGYNTKFVDAARRTAQLKVDLAHRGPAGFFSWPSLGYGAGYTGDEAAMEGSEPAIRNFLINFAERSGARAVHIIAHSMGNRGLLRAMDAIANAAASAAPVRFGQIFLAAPDVDAQLFENLAAAYGRLATRATLYVSSNDKAIGLSRRLHRFARVGLAPPVAVVPGVDTIDASHVNLGLLGHSYAAEMRPVLSDIHRLIQGDAAPDHRFGLRKALGGDASYWEFVR